MKHNTSCKNCIFAHEASSDSPCDFNIISNIKEDKTITIQDNFFHIENYLCKYGLSKNTYEQYKDEFNKNNIDIKDHVKQNAYIKYYLVIDYYMSEYPLELLCNDLESLNIEPKFISLLLYQNNKIKPNDAIDIFRNKMKPHSKWKIHSFLEDIDRNYALHSIFQTNAKANDSQYFLILKPEQIKTFIDNNSIENIQYIISIKQPACNILKQKDTVDSNNFHTVFINFDSYQGLCKNISQSLEHSLDTLENMTIAYYD